MSAQRQIGRQFSWQRGLHGALVALALVLPSLPSHAADATRAPGRVPRPVIEAADGKTCVADPATMRRNHMDLLKHQRDGTMREGIRAPKFSLTGCVDCHASKKTNSVTASGENFCRSCHEYAGVTLDCFDCHRTTPSAKPAALAPAAAVAGAKP